MFSTNLKRPLLALAVTAGLLAVAGPASAATTHEPSPRAAMGTIEELMEFMDYTDDAAVDKDLNQPDMGIREQPTQVNAPHGLSIGSSEVFELNTIRSNGDGSGQVAGPARLHSDSNEVAVEGFFLDMGTIETLDLVGNPGDGSDISAPGDGSDF